MLRVFLLILTNFVSYFSDELREHLKNAPKMIMTQQRTEASDSDSDSSDESSSEGLWVATLLYSALKIVWRGQNLGMLNSKQGQAIQ